MDARLDRLRKTLATGSDLRMRLVFSYTRDDVGTDGPVAWRDLAPVAKLYDEARGSTDPLVLELLLMRCDLPTVAACDRVDVARRLTVADTQNQVAWLALADQLAARNDNEGARAALLRAATASHWHEHTRELIAALVQAAPPDLSPDERRGWLIDAIGVAAAVNLPGVHSFSHLYANLPALRGDAAVRDAHLRILDTIARDGDSLSTLMMANGSARRLGVPSNRLAALRRTDDAMRWALLTVEPADDLFAPDDTDAATMDRRLARLQDLVDHTERERAERVLVARHVGEAEAARLYVASLSPGMRAAHDAGRW